MLTQGMYGKTGQPTRGKAVWSKRGVNADGKQISDPAAQKAADAMLKTIQEAQGKGKEAKDAQGALVKAHKDLSQGQQKTMSKQAKEMNKKPGK